MGCANGKNIVAPQKSNKVSPFDDKNVSPVKDDNNAPVTNATQNNEAKESNAKKHYLPQQKKRVRETITMKQSTDQELIWLLKFIKEQRNTDTLIMLKISKMQL